MATLVIDPQTLPETIRSLIGDTPRVFVSAKPGRVVLTPATCEADEGPEEGCIDPADYDDETDYINAIPGLAERLLAYRNLPDSEFTPVPREYFNA